MTRKALLSLVAALLIQCGSAQLAAPLQAQARAGGSGGPAAGSPHPEGRGTVPLTPQAPQVPGAMDEDAQTEPQEAPGAQQGCPNRGGKLELIV